MGNVMRERLYWEKKEKKKCRMCEQEEETYEHAWEKCAKMERRKVGKLAERDWQNVRGRGGGKVEMNRRKIEGV